MSYGRGFFGEATTRLARILGIAGAIPIKLTEGVSPVIILADGTLPGYGGQSLRRWQGFTTVTGVAVSTSYVIRATSDVIITRFNWWTNNASNEFTLGYLPAATADPIVVASRAHHYLDRNTSGDELAPILSGIGGGVGFAGAKTILKGRQPGTNTMHSLPLEPFLLEKGAGLWLWGAANVTYYVTIAGMDAAN